MFVLRQEHMAAFSQAALECFEDRMADHLLVRFQEECAELGEEKVRARIHDGIKKAARYDITAESDVARFIRYMFSFGPDFDTARATDWAAPILNDKQLSANERLEKIRAVAREKRAGEKT